MSQAPRERWLHTQLPGDGAGGGGLLYFMKKMFLTKKKKRWPPGKADVSLGGSARATSGGLRGYTCVGEARPPLRTPPLNVALHAKVTVFPLCYTRTSLVWHSHACGCVYTCTDILLR